MDEKRPAVPDAVALTPQEAEAALSDVGNGVDPVTVEQLATAGFVLARKAHT